MKNIFHRYPVTFALCAIFLVASLMLITGVYDPMAPQNVLLTVAEVAAGQIDPEVIKQIAKQVEDLTKSVTKSVEETTEKVKSLGGEFTEKTKAGEKISLELKEQVDKVLTEQGGLRSALDELKTKTGEIEQAVAKRIKGSGEPEQPKTPGILFTEDEAVKKFMEKRDRGRVRMDIKTIVTGDLAGLIPADRRPGILPMPERRMTVRDLITPGRTNSNVVQYWRETGFTNAADAVSEGTLKPESTITGELVNAPVSTIAHIMTASKQILDDSPQLQSQIDGRLRYGLAYEEEVEILLGDGSGTQLLGIIPQATAFAAQFQPEQMQRIDVIRLALLQSELALFPATGTVLNPIDWARIELTKDLEGRYIFSQPQNEGTPRLWGRPIVSTPAMTNTKFLVGAFKLGAQIFDREDANVELSTEDGDNFKKNLVTLRAEERLALAVYRGEAFVYGTFQATT